jgi:hypothetical protein
MSDAAGAAPGASGRLPAEQTAPARPGDRSPPNRGLAEPTAGGDEDDKEAPTVPMKKNVEGTPTGAPQRPRRPPVGVVSTLR